MESGASQNHEFPFCDYNKGIFCCPRKSFSFNINRQIHNDRTVDINNLSTETVPFIEDLEETTIYDEDVLEDLHEKAIKIAQQSKFVYSLYSDYQ